MMREVLFIAIWGIGLAGCTHEHLKWDAVNQAETLTEIYQQQVLDNLAMFAENPHALPFFAYPKDGNASVTDNGSLDGNVFDAFRTGAAGRLSRQNMEQWGLTPVVDPEKLARMRCAYQRAVGCPDEFCIKCCELEQQWQGLLPRRIQVIDPQTYKPILNPDTGKPYDLRCLDGSPMFVDGVATQYALENCIDPQGYTQIPGYDCDEPCAVHCGWLAIGCKKDLPKKFCGLVGRHGDTVVWVKPGFEDHLTRLTLKILDYAINDPPRVVPREKVVSFFIDQAGNPVKKEDAYGSVAATIGINDHVTSVLKVDKSVNPTVAQNAKNDARAVLLLEEFRIEKQLLEADVEELARASNLTESAIEDNLKQAVRADDAKNRLTTLLKNANVADNKIQDAINRTQRLEQLKTRIEATGPDAQFPGAYPDPSPILIPKQRTILPTEVFRTPLDIQRELRAIGTN